MMRFFRRFYDRMMIWSQHRHAPWFLFGVAFAQSSFFPLPVESMLFPMALANRRRALFYAGLCTVGSVLGGIAGYMIGSFLYESVGKPILAFYGKENFYAEFQMLYQQYGAWIVAAGGVTPLPYKVVTIASGAMHLNLLTFVVASTLARGSRFFLEAILIYFMGDAISRFIDRYFGLVTMATFVLVLGGFVVLGILV